MSQVTDSGTPIPPTTEHGTTTPAVRRRRRLLWGGVGVALVAVVGVAGGLVVANRSSGPEAVSVVQRPDTRQSPPAAWLSGVSGDGTFDDFAAWRGRPVDIAGTWSDNNDAMLKLAELQPGAQFGSWDRPLDIAIGAFTGDGESWQTAANGKYDARWRQSLTRLAKLRADKPGTTYIRFAHEMNGDWYPWSVSAEEKDAFIEAWKRFRALQVKIFPGAKLVFCPNRESANGMDWRELFPGREYVDVLGVDYYNHNPYVGTADEWTASLDELDDFGAPKGLNGYLDFARSVGLPLAVPEWSGDADAGDSPAFIQGMYDFFTTHGGDGAGALLYEIQFNVDIGNHQFALFNSRIRMTESAKKYQELW